MVTPLKNFMISQRTPPPQVGHFFHLLTQYQVLTLSLHFGCFSSFFLIIIFRNQWQKPSGVQQVCCAAYCEIASTSLSQKPTSRSCSCAERKQMIRRGRWIHVAPVVSKLILDQNLVTELKPGLRSYNCISYLTCVVQAAVLCIDKKRACSRNVVVAPPVYVIVLLWFFLA